MKNRITSAGTDVDSEPKAEITTSRPNNGNTNVSRRLKIGDKIYGENRMYGISEVLVVEKITPTQAVCGDIRFKIDLIDNKRVRKIGQEYGSWNSTSYFLETDELKVKYFRQNAINRLKGFDYKTLSNETLKVLVTAINGG